jgi:hypothetical protein
MDCWLVVDGERHPVEASSAFAPFGDVLKFARALAADSLPHEFTWQEEGPWIDFKALSIAPSSPDFRLVIERNSGLFLDGEFNRMEVACGLLEALRGVALDCPGAESEWEFPYFLIEDFERDQARGFAAEPNDLPVSRAHFVFYQCGGYGGVWAPAFSIWVDNAVPQTMMMDDNPRLWLMWFELLRKILRGDFPFEFDFNREEPGAGEDEESSSLMSWDSWNYFLADSGTKVEHFRLQVAREMKILGERSEVCQVTLDRREFVAAFVRAFKEFLKTDYLGFLARGENRIDLRDMPLDGIE